MEYKNNRLFDWVGTVQDLERKWSKNGKEFLVFTLYNKETGYIKFISFTNKHFEMIENGEELRILSCYPRKSSYVGMDGVKKQSYTHILEGFETFDKPVLTATPSYEEKVEDEKLEELDFD